MSVMNSEKQTVNRVSEEVVSVIAARATLGIPGVNRLSETIADNLTKKISGKDHATKGIKIFKEDGGIGMDIYINVDYETKIPDLAWNVQSSVKKTVEKVTGLTVKHVNIHVLGVTLPKRKTQEG